MAWMKRDQFYPSIDRGCRCSICGSDPRRNLAGVAEPVYTTGICIDLEGLFTICESCLVEGANLLGWVSKDKADQLRESNRKLGKENKELRERTAVLEQLKTLL